MTCRAPTSSVTCAGTPTGSVMTYDNERRLATWQNTPSNPTSTASYWYDGEGQRVAQTLNGVTTYYVGSDEEITGGTLLKYYHIPGLPVLGTITGVTRTYLASDGLGSETVDLSYNGTVLAQALYGPYGVGRYATGTMPTSKGYTGQRQDSGSGLDYYGARYYDAAVGQFTSADTAQGPNRYGYVGGNPETATDPTGKRLCYDDSVSSCIALGQLQPRISNVSTTTNTTQTTNGDYTTTNTTTQTTVITYTDGTTRTFSAVTNTSVFCDDTCKNLQYRAKVIQGLENQQHWWEVGLDAASLAFDIGRLILDVERHKWGGALEDFASGAADLATLLKTLGGNGLGKFTALIDRVQSVISAARGLLEAPVVGGLIQDGLSALSTFFVPAANEVLDLGTRVVEENLGMSVTDLFNAGVQFFNGQIADLDNNVQRDQSENISTFCQQDGGCPAG